MIINYNPKHDINHKALFNLQISLYELEQFVSETRDEYARKVYRECIGQGRYYLLGQKSTWHVQ